MNFICLGFFNYGDGNAVYIFILTSTRHILECKYNKKNEKVFSIVFF